MDIVQMLAQLKAQRELLDQAIQGMERLVAGSARRRGRPPAWLSQPKDASAQQEAPAPPRVPAPAARTSKKRILTREARQKMADAQRRRWAAVKKQSTGSAN